MLSTNHVQLTRLMGVDDDDHEQAAGLHERR